MNLKRKIIWKLLETDRNLIGHIIEEIEQRYPSNLLISIQQLSIITKEGFQTKFAD